MHIRIMRQPSRGDFRVILRQVERAGVGPTPGWPDPIYVRPHLCPFLTFGDWIFNVVYPSSGPGARWYGPDQVRPELQNFSRLSAGLV